MAEDNDWRVSVVRWTGLVAMTLIGGCCLLIIVHDDPGRLTGPISLLLEQLEDFAMVALGIGGGAAGGALAASRRKTPLLPAAEHRDSGGT